MAWRRAGDKSLPEPMMAEPKKWAEPIELSNHGLMRQIFLYK